MEPLITEYIYHIYNHSNGDELLFRENKNYDFFLEKYKNYILPVAETYAYCLMPNHFHFLIGIKTSAEIGLMLKSNNSEKYKELKTKEERETFASHYISKQFSNLFSSYTQAFNKLYERRGSMFMKNFKRKQVESDAYFLKMVKYIHLNPVHHGFVTSPDEWEHSSYNIMLSAEPTWLKRKEVVEWFGDLENFKYCHQEDMNLDDF